MALEHILPPPLPPLLSFPLLLGFSIAPPSWSKDDCFDRTRLNKTVCLIGRQGRQGTHERHGRHSRQWTRVITDQGEKSFVEELYTSTFHLVFPRPACPKESIRGLGWREAPSCRHSGSPLSLDLSSYWKMKDTQEDINRSTWMVNEEGGWLQRFCEGSARFSDKLFESWYDNLVQVERL